MLMTNLTKKINWIRERPMLLCLNWCYMLQQNEYNKSHALAKLIRPKAKNFRQPLCVICLNELLINLINLYEGISVKHMEKMDWLYWFEVGAIIFLPTLPWLQLKFYDLARTETLVELMLLISRSYDNYCIL